MLTQGARATGEAAFVSGSAAAPLAGAAVASLAGLVAGGTYDVEIALTLTGTAEVALRNAEVRRGATQKAILPTLSGAGQHRYRMQLSLGAQETTIDLRAIAAATAGSVYTATIQAERVA